MRETMRMEMNLMIKGHDCSTILPGPKLMYHQLCRNSQILNDRDSLVWPWFKPTLQNSTSPSCHGQTSTHALHESDQVCLEAKCNVAACPQARGFFEYKIVRFLGLSLPFTHTHAHIIDKNSISSVKS
jgi:hypothetical protein